MPHDRTVIITGATDAIGRATARRFGKAGAKLVLADADMSAGEGLEDELKAAGADAFFVHADAAGQLAIHNIIAQALDAYGRVDVLVNNASAVAKGDFLEAAEAEIDTLLDANLKAPLLMAQAFAKQVLAQQAADEEAGADPYYAIVNMSSVEAITTGPDNVVYAATKGGVNQATKALSIALAPHGVRVNAVGPGAINTDRERADYNDAKARSRVLSRTPLGRVGDPEEVASVVYFLASDEASYITGQCIYVEGGRLALNYVTKEEGAE